MIKIGDTNKSDYKRINPSTGIAKGTVKNLAKNLDRKLSDGEIAIGFMTAQPKLATLGSEEKVNQLKLKRKTPSPPATPPCTSLSWKAPPKITLTVKPKNGQLVTKTIMKVPILTSKPKQPKLGIQLQSYKNGLKYIPKFHLPNQNRPNQNVVKKQISDMIKRLHDFFQSLTPHKGIAHKQDWPFLAKICKCPVYWKTILVRAVSPCVEDEMNSLSARRGSNEVSGSSYGSNTSSNGWILNNNKLLFFASVNILFLLCSSITPQL